MNEKDPRTFPEKLLRDIELDRPVQAFINKVNKISNMLSLFEPISCREDADGSRYLYYLGTHDEKDIDVVITLKESDDRRVQWFFGFLDFEEELSFDDVNVESIVEMADQTAVLMPAESIIERLNEALKHSRVADLRKLKEMEERKVTIPVDGVDSQRVLFED